ncbi:acetate kinase [Roseospira marina]|uniref:Acetate kinase n=1 Tax=Roseospira marina TaxID=140057 RepID=A0A5M6IBG9_9PROT|nr:acetate kinase [Roseospira marina]KAA5605307.1 acetate kinase [Roseospira marina]MBB4314775.1 acetate kinase [Roseospira marina]MBB5087764.1 acetate kinase [Roseospira marina]
MRSDLILVINCGSSSLKSALFTTTRAEPLMRGLAECLGTPEARLRLVENGDRIDIPLAPHADHAAALDPLLGHLSDRHMLARVGAVGHRVVHGGETFTESALLTDAVLADIEACAALAPLHNPANLSGIRSARAALPHLPQVAVFDTAFHQTMPPSAYLYALPRDLYRRFGVRRYGFHGTSHRYVAGEAVRLLRLAPDDHGLIVAHLGNGASITAVRDGRSVDTTMGMTPLEGLVMGTRAGDVDVGALAHVARQRGDTIADLERILNAESGLLGLSGLSGDCRALQAAAEAGHRGAIEALDVFIHRIARHIGALAMSLDRLDALVFTGGIGENSAFVRGAVLNRLTVLGFERDPSDDGAPLDGGARILSRGRGPVTLVIPTNEEWMIAQDTATLAGLTRGPVVLKTAEVRVSA